MGRGGDGEESKHTRRGGRGIFAELAKIPPAEKRDYTMKELAQYNGEDKTKPLMFAIDGIVYDITRWVSKHPGGRLLINQAGEDATDAYYAFHPERAKSDKYLKPLQVGRIVGEGAQPPAHIVEFREMRAQFEKEGLFKPDWKFYTFMLGHILVAEFIAWYFMTSYPSSWVVWVLGCALLGSAQAQAGWLQHDFGHLSVFKTRNQNEWAHRVIICFLKAASSAWWNYRHSRHHAKPNIPIKDPDVTLPYVFVLGENPAKKWASRRKGYMPYNLQHLYYWVLGPPMLLPTYFHYENIRFIILKKKWIDLAFMVGFFLRYICMFAPTFGVAGTFGIYFFMRSLESHWFVWVTQMSHIPMDIDADRHKDWVRVQAEATCNAHPSTFNDWFTGHLNYQIEHHLFPLMPRHNYIKIHKKIKAYFAKHNIPYTSKTLYRAFADIPLSLRDYGRVWYDAYNGN